MTRTYDIFDAASPKTPLATVDADSPADALAEYAIAQGYADPRADDETDWFATLFDGTTSMVFENTDLLAVARDA